MIAVIYNPNSGGFREETLRAIESELRSRGLPHRLMPTERVGHAEALAAQAVADGADALACYGGDGTAYEVINGAGVGRAQLLLIPSGTGNDLIRTLKLPGDAMRALRLQLDSPARAMDAVKINDRLFLNVSGMGLDVSVLREYALLRGRKMGSRAYRVAVYQAMRTFRPMDLRVRWDGDPAQDVRCSMLSIGNGQYIGGGMRCLPHADPFDGLLDVLVLRPVPNWLIAILLPLFIAGAHTRLPVIHMKRVRTAEITSDRPIWLQMDGELIELERANIEILPGAVTMRLPVKEM